MTQSSVVTVSCAGNHISQQVVSQEEINSVIKGLLEDTYYDCIVVQSGYFVRIFIFSYLGMWVTATGLGLAQAEANLPTDVNVLRILMPARK